MNSYYGQPPQREENNNLGIAIGALGAGALAGFGGRALYKNINARKAKAKAAGGPRGGQGGTATRDNPTAAEVYASADKKYPDPGVGKDVEYRFPAGGTDEDMFIVDEATGKFIKRGDSTAASYAELESSPKVKTAAYEEGSAVDKLMKSLLPEVNKEAGQMTATESSRQTRALDKEDQRLARGILADMKGEFRYDVIEEQPTTLVQVQESREPQVAVNAMETVNTADDQSDGRFLRNLQRNEDVNMAAVSEAVVDNKEAVLDSRISDALSQYSTEEAKQATQVGQILETQGPLSAEDTLNAARDQMVSLRSDLEAKGFIPGTTRYERALAEQFKTGESNKIGELAITGKSLNNVTLPSGPMRQTMQSTETNESPILFSRSVVNVGEDPFSNITEAASGSSIRGRSRVQNQPDQFTQRVDSSGRPIEDDRVYRDPGGTNTYSFGEELSELEMDVPSPEPNRLVRDSITGKMTSEFTPKGKRVIQLYQGEGQPTKSMFVPTTDPGGVGIYGEERSFAAGPITKYGENQGNYTSTAQRKPTDLSYTPKKGADLTDLSTKELQTFASKAVKKNPKAAQAAMGELDRRETSKRSMETSEALRRANIEGRDPQQLLRSMGFGV
tara:strand:+ start:4620 stop:6473 length:1854 start_codon:yes stop_codon:yes gene_type:complete